jgi:hypothetical protein
MDLGIANSDFIGFFHAIVLKICGDSLDLRKQVESFEKLLD